MSSIHSTFYGQVAKANPHWKVLKNSQVKAVFNGPHSYISPTWYGSGPAAPTWNYAAVHIMGLARTLDQQQTLESVHMLVRQYEPTLLKDEGLMPQDYQAKLSAVIVGFKSEIQQIEGKHKLGQHKSVAEQQGTVAGLARSQHTDATALLAYMQQTGLGIG